MISSYLVTNLYCEFVPNANIYVIICLISDMMFKKTKLITNTN